MGFFRFCYGINGMLENDWLGSFFILLGVLGKGCKRMMRKNLENGKCFIEVICYIFFRRVGCLV